MLWLILYFIGFGTTLSLFCDDEFPFKFSLPWQITLTILPVVNIVFPIIMLIALICVLFKVKNGV